MKVIKELELKIGEKNKIIYFGMPETDEEINEMHKLRYDVYSSKGYVSPELFPDGLERDEYDKDKKCSYFIAKIDDKIIGTVRLIKDLFLPVEKDCFKFKEPEDIKKIPRNQRAEISRLVAIPYSDNTYLPRNIITIFLINSLVAYCLKNNILGGYAFIKDNLRVKLEKLKMPIHLIKNHIQIYPQGGILYGYFNNENNKVIPMYFITEEFKKYTDKIINNSLMFKKIDSNTHVLRENFYNKFLKFLKII